MGPQLTDKRHDELALNDEVSLDQHPAAVYLAGLSPSSRRTMRGALDTISQLGLGSEDATAWDVPWHRLRIQHTQAIPSAQAERYVYTTANRMLSALRATLKAAWKLGLERRGVPESSQRGEYQRRDGPRRSRLVGWLHWRRWRLPPWSRCRSATLLRLSQR